MKVYLGKYIDHYSWYGILRKFEETLGEARVDSWSEWLSESVFQKPLDWLNSRERTISIKLDNYDTWNMDSTLALIVLPMLRQLKASKHGSGLVDSDDAPDEFKPITDDEMKDDENIHKRWDYVLGEMIWAFEQLQPDCDWEDQYCSGNIDWKFVESNVGNGLTEIQKGDNHTFAIDMDGRKKHQDRITNGLRLFGKYYQSLWD